MDRMARPLRIQYPGAVYHAMARGNQSRVIFADDTDRQRFLETPAESCEKAGSRNRISFRIWESQAVSRMILKPGRKLERVREMLLASEPENETAK